MDTMMPIEMENVEHFLETPAYRPTIKNGAIVNVNDSADFDTTFAYYNMTSAEKKRMKKRRAKRLAKREGR